MSGKAAGRRHALVVGGTGMLREVSLALAERYETVSVVARRQQGLSRLVDAAQVLPGQVHAIAVDYHDTPALTGTLKDAIKAWGPIQLAVVWIHSTAPQAAPAVARLVGSADRPAGYFHVLGSGAANPAQAGRERFHHFKGRANLHYYQVILGFVRESARSRWLTNAEISQGVLQAIKVRAPQFIVGRVKPWPERP